MLGVGPVQNPPRGGVTGHRTEQFFPIPQGRQMRQRVTAVGDQHRQNSQHPPRKMDRHSGIGIEKCLRPAKPPGRFAKTIFLTGQARAAAQLGRERPAPRPARPRSRSRSCTLRNGPCPARAGRGVVFALGPSR